MPFFIKKIGIDLGTANTLVFIPNKGIILNEPSVVAVAMPENRVLAVGNEAKTMIGRTPESIIAYRPMKDGVIADYRVTEAMLRYFIGKTVGKWNLLKPDVLISVPAGVTSTERRSVVEAAIKAGAKNAFIVKEPVLAAIGAGIPIHEPRGHMVVDIGGGTTDSAVISLGGIVASMSLKVAGNKIDQAIADYIKKQYLKEINEDGFDGLFLDAVSLEPIGNYADSLDQFKDNKEWQKELLTYLETIHKEFNDKLFILNLVEFETIENYDNFANQGNAISQLFSVSDGGLDEVYLMGRWQDNIIFYRDTKRAFEAEEYAAKNNKYFLAYSQIETCQNKNIKYVLSKYNQFKNQRSYLNPTCSAHHTYNIAVNNYEKIKEFI